MYQFSGAPGSNYQHPQYSQPGGFNSNGQFPPAQPIQTHPQPQHPSMQQQHYQISPPTVQSSMSQYPNFSPVHENQAHVFNGHGSSLQLPPARNSYLVNAQFTNQQHEAYGSRYVAPISQQSGPFRPQGMTPDQSFPYGQTRHLSQGSTMGHPNQSKESCYNCGAPDHWAQDCPEPRRAVPAGQKNRPFKRQKTHGDTILNNPQTALQQQPNLQRGWTDPTVAQQLFSMSSNGPNTQAATLSEQSPWAPNQNQKPRMSSASSDSVLLGPWAQQQSHRGPFTPQSAGLSRQNSWSQPQLRQHGNPNLAGTDYHPYSDRPLSQNYSSTSLAAMSDAQTPWNLQRYGFDTETLPLMRAGEQTAVNSHHVHYDGIPAPQATPWSVQSLPTPAPSVESQIPSPATSNLNSIDQYSQQTPRCTDSPGNRHDSVSSASKKNQDPRTHQAEMVANLFNTTAQASESKINSPENQAAASSNVGETEEELEDLYSLDFPDIIFEQNLKGSNPAVPVAEPLSLTEQFNANDQPPAANASLTGASASKYIRDLPEEDFLKNVQESSQWELLKDDPIFAKIKANTTTVTFTELIERRRFLVKASTEVEEDDQEDNPEDDHQHQETEEERLDREQEERLTALGVTGTAKPVKTSPTDNAFAGTPSPADTLVARHVCGDPGWKHYENGRPVNHRSVSFESPPSANKDNRSVSSTRHHSPLDATPGKSTDTSPNLIRPEQPYRKRTYGEASEENDDMLRRQDSEPKQRKQRLKQPKVAAAYGRRW